MVSGLVSLGAEYRIIFCAMGGIGLISKASNTTLDFGHQDYAGSSFRCRGEMSDDVRAAALL